MKLYAWEGPFERRINHLRWLELEQIRCRATYPHTQSLSLIFKHATN